MKTSPMFIATAFMFVVIFIFVSLSFPSEKEIFKPKIISREEWGALPPRCKYENNSFINAITIHHTATSNNYRDAAYEIRSIQRFHMYGRGWCDIGYHFIIDRNGSIYECRPLWAVGAHVKGHNYGNIGISLLGNYEEIDMSEEQFRALISLVAWLCWKYNIPVDNIKGHRDYASTKCPGRFVYEKLPLIRREVWRMLMKSL